MAFTAITVTGTFEQADGSVPTGIITACLSESIKNGTVELEPGPLVGHLDAGGHLVDAAGAPFFLLANDDAGTTPVGSYYHFQIILEDSPIRTFHASIPSAAPSHTIDLSALEPS